MINILCAACYKTVLVYVLIKQNSASVKTGKTGCVCIVQCSLYV